MTALLLAAAALGLVLGAGVMVWPVPRDHGPADAPALYARRIAGAMMVGASLFLGGFTLAFTLANS